MLTDFENGRTLGFPREGERPSPLFSDPISVVDPYSGKGCMTSLDAHSEPPHDYHEDR